MSRYIPVYLGQSKLGLKAEDFISGSDIASIEKSIKPGRFEAISLDGAVSDALLKDIGVDVMVDIVATRGFWPSAAARHWHSFIFLNYCLIGNHTFGQIGLRGAFDWCNIQSGRCFAIDPRRIHWLEPISEQAELCLLLQFSVPRRDKKTFNKIVEWMALPF
jgi:hypothetical protein